MLPMRVRCPVLALSLIAAGCLGSSAEPAPSTAANAASEPTPEPTPGPTPDPADDLLVDLHVDTITAMVENHWSWEDERLEASLPELVEAGVDVVVEAIWIPRAAKDPRGLALDRVARIRAMVRGSRGRAALVTGPGQLRAAVREGRLAVVVALEGGTALTEGPKTMHELADLGVAMFGLTWTESSAFADSSAEPRAGDAGGLTEAGRAVVAAANDRGLMLDVSHMSDRATADTVAASRAPVLASHSNAFALAGTARNLRPELLAAIAEKGGLVGVMFHGPFVVKGEPATRAHVVAQATHLVQEIGAEHVGLGSDWDGKIQSPPDLAGAPDLPALVADLEAGLDPSAVRAVSGGSFLRFWDAVRAASASAGSRSTSRN